MCSVPSLSGCFGRYEGEVGPSYGVSMAELMVVGAPILLAGASTASNAQHRTLIFRARLRPRSADKHTVGTDTCRAHPLPGADGDGDGLEANESGPLGRSLTDPREQQGDQE